MAAPNPEPARCCATTEVRFLAEDPVSVYRCDREVGHGGTVHEGGSVAGQDGTVTWRVDPRPTFASTGAPVPTVSEVRAQIEELAFNAFSEGSSGMDGLRRTLDALAAAGYLHLGPVVPDDPQVIRDRVEEAKAGACPSCGPGYRYGDDGCRHTPTAAAAPRTFWDLPLHLQADIDQIIDEKAAAEAALAARDAELESAGRRLYKLGRLEDSYDDFIHENGTPPTLLWCLEAAEEADRSFRKLAALHYEDRCRDRAELKELRRHLAEHCVGDVCPEVAP